MKILYSFPQRVGRTGVGMTAWHQVLGLSQAGHTVTLVCGSLERPFPSEADIRRVETMRLWGRIPVPMRLFGTVGTGRLHDLLTAAHVSRSKEPWEIFHGWPLGSLWTMTQFQKRNVPTVLERPNVHTAEAFRLVTQEAERLGLQTGKDNPHRHDAAKLDREEKEYARTDFIACPSDFVRDSFLRRGFDEARCIRHRYGFDDTAIEFNETVPPGRFRFLFLGRGEPRKGVHFLLEAWERADLQSKAELYLAGSFEEEYADYLARHYDQEGVSYLGLVNDVPKLLREVHALVLPSIEEGSALVSYECRGAGVPLLASDSTGAYAPEVDGALVHPTGDTAILAQQMKRLVEDDAYYAQLKQRLLPLRKELTWSAAGKALGETYERIISRS